MKLLKEAAPLALAIVLCGSAASLYLTVWLIQEWRNAR